jgi:hypothetical protein
MKIYKMNKSIASNILKRLGELQATLVTIKLQSKSKIKCSKPEFINVQNQQKVIATTLQQPKT